MFKLVFEVARFGSRRDLSSLATRLGDALFPCQFGARDVRVGTAPPHPVMAPLAEFLVDLRRVFERAREVHRVLLSGDSELERFNARDVVVEPDVLEQPLHRFPWRAHQVLIVKFQERFADVHISQHLADVLHSRFGTHARMCLAGNHATRKSDGQKIFLPRATSAPAVGLSCEPEADRRPQMIAPLQKNDFNLLFLHNVFEELSSGRRNREPTAAHTHYVNARNCASPQQPGHIAALHLIREGQRVPVYMRAHRLGQRTAVSLVAAISHGAVFELDAVIEMRRAVVPPHRLKARRLRENPHVVQLGDEIALWDESLEPRH